MPARRVLFTCSAAPEGAWRAPLQEAVQLARILAAPAGSFPSLSALGSEIPPRLPATQLGPELRSPAPHPPPPVAGLQPFRADSLARLGARGDSTQTGRRRDCSRQLPAELPRIPQLWQEGGRKAATLQSGQAAWPGVGEPGALRPRGLPAARQSQKPRTAGYLPNCFPAYIFGPPFALTPRNEFPPVPPRAEPGPRRPARTG